MIWTLFLYKWKRIIKQPVLFFAIMLFPFLLLASFAFIISELSTDKETQRITVAVLDDDQTFETKALIDQLQNEDQLKEALTLVPMTQEEAAQQLHNNEISAMITIPDGFTRDLRYGENTPITVTTNESQPLESSLVRLLLNGAAYYISAAQSAINTVNDLYISDLADNEQKGEFLQQLIVQYTLFALDRNELFDIEEVQSGATLGWQKHFLIALILISVLLTCLLFQNLFYRKEERNINERLKSLNINMFPVVFSQFFTYFLFAIINLFLLSCLINFKYPFDWLFAKETIVTWIFFSILISALSSFLDLFLPSPSSRTSIGIVGFLVLAFLSGLVIPTLYLPDWVQENSSAFLFSNIYDALQSFILNGIVPVHQWITTFIISFLFLSLVLLRIWVKEGRNAY